MHAGQPTAKRDWRVTYIAGWFIDVQGWWKQMGTFATEANIELIRFPYSWTSSGDIWGVRQVTVRSPATEQRGLTVTMKIFTGNEK